MPLIFEMSYGQHKVEKPNRLQPPLDPPFLSSLQDLQPEQADLVRKLSCIAWRQKVSVPRRIGRQRNMAETRLTMAAVSKNRSPPTIRPRCQTG